jgi:hypothetical protein
MTFVRTLAAFALAVALAAGALGCGGPRTYRVAGSQRDPGADATIQIENIAGGNHLVTITVRHLTPPDRLGEGNSTFMVWIRPATGPAALESNLEYNPDTREGTATATTPHPRFTVLITAEADAGAPPSGPSDFVVFQQEVEL